MARRIFTMTTRTGAASKLAQKLPVPIAFDHLPPEIARRRILDSSEAADFCRISLAHWRRLYRTGKVPRPIRLSARKYGWRLGDLVDFIDHCAAAE
jgi:predicted DNA-binding transcriptional regulator AlpA